MTTFQICAIALLVASIGWQYIPAFTWPARTPNTLKQIASVIAIRDQAVTPEVKQACNELLQALLR